jgi:hypothetical protein
MTGAGSGAPKNNVVPFDYDVKEKNLLIRYPSSMEILPLTLIGRPKCTVTLLVWTVICGI